ncbi:hypothetical protein LB534_18570 [Mesorhizobium sp. CA18]|uniref:hypothetical protein n=1 Tax=unclassified Mesorhizobium TaxID=325217 RepID=UPI001CCF73AF|nr:MULTISPECIES: hypothetical protein [unclassified Mesorhizobium]MBZ9736923.1 hypothetical protein [Mesorhizobium sp. CA9]MBZ9827294.1 hypothetical protein [Mesorhizobium sp. CA18]MBZ9832681.1 hypothetical protein [Mesorhizobium sp. CA2]MBZ9838958.1 hypothetical protein [Mesorhizobium sp. CA3]MBZ9879411.1 hypothetical protein [Mesorhizobium sp. Ca11]
MLSSTIRSAAMTSLVGSQLGPGAMHQASRPQASETFPGKRAESVGHLAKASVFETDIGEPNAQGKSASRIARMDLTVLSPTGSGEGQEPETATGTPTETDGTEDPNPSA